jgi:beta-glucosidase/6-phospho-beta-glucosidase/beta-galactosidase
LPYLIKFSIYDIPGQISADGKSPSIWDTFSFDPTHSEDGGNTSTATETYTKWQEDIALMKSYGVNSYRLSLSWTRILPDGVAGSKVNKAGVEWYRKVLKGLLEAGIVSSICESVTRRPFGTP